MIRLHDGLDYLIYKIYVWGGLAAIVIFSLVMSLAGLLPPTGNRALIILSLPVTIYFLGILAYWWWVFLFKGIRDLKKTLENPPEQPPGVRDLKNKSTLHRALSLYGGNFEEMLEYEKKSNRPVIIWYGLQNLLAFWVLGNFWVWNLFQKHLPSNYIKAVWVPGVFIILALFFVLTPLLLWRARKAGTAAYLTPLGLYPMKSMTVELDLSGTPVDDQTRIPDGTMLLAGNRLGRRVVIEIRGKRSTTRAEAPLPPFEISSPEGKLIPHEGAPDAVQKALKGLRKAKRWKGIMVIGNSNGITIERESRRQNMWLFDLWLAERLLENLKA
jgi:hypothetical protein